MTRYALLLLAGAAFAPAAAYAGSHGGGGHMGGHMGGSTSHSNSFSNSNSFSSSRSFSFSNSNSFSHGGNFFIGGGHHFHGGHFVPGRGSRHMRVQRGFFLDAFWFAPEFWVQDWSDYGFDNPGDETRWIRYYDDALLVDRYGNVVDVREGVNWDGHGRRWGRYDDGIPYYAQGGEREGGYGYDERRTWVRGDDGYARGGWDHREGGHDGYGHDGRDHGGYEHGGYDHGGYEHDGYRREEHREGYAEGGYGSDHGMVRTRVYTGGPGAMPPPPPPPPGFNHYGYGAGGYAGTVVVTETTVTPSRPTYTEEIVEEVVRHRVHHVRVRPHCSCVVRHPVVVHHAPPPPPPRGERG